MPAIPEEAFFTLAPDWVCEVLSPSTQKIDRSRKLRIYAEAGVAHAWLVDPIERTLEVLRLKDGAWTIVGVCVDSDVVRIHPFEAIQIELGRLWPDAPPAAPTPVPPDAEAKHVDVGIELLREARILAAAEGRSVSGLIRDQLEELVRRSKAYDAARQPALERLRQGRPAVEAGVRAAA